MNDNTQTDGKQERPATVLVVDDSALVRQLVADILRHAGYAVDMADGGAAALDLLASRRYDAVVTDLHMPEPDGFAMIEQIQLGDSAPPVIVLTGSHAKDIDAAVRALRLGAQDYLTKPLGRPEVLLMAVERVIERKREREAVREALARYRELFESVPIGLFRCAGDGRLIDANQAFAVLLGYADRRALLDAEIQCLGAEPEAAARLRAALDNNGVASGTELPLRRRDGTLAWVSVNARAHHAIAGGMPVFEGSVEDVSFRKETEERLRESQKLEAVGRLAGGLAHDFNSLLGIILGTVSLLARDSTVEGLVAKELDRIRKAAERAARLTRQLLAFSRKQVLQPRRVDLNAVVRRLSAVLNSLSGPSIQLRLHLSPEPVLVHVDPAEMEQVIVNLVTNACDAMPNGGELTLRTEEVVVDPGSRVAVLPPGSYGLLSVRDTGVGMDAATRDRMFEPFFTTKGRARASGLGLSATHGIVTQSGGHIDVESEPGRGTSVKVFLPLLEHGETPQPSATELAVAGGHETLLVVEDEPDLLHLMATALRRYGYEVLEATDAVSAVAAANGHAGSIDLLVTDVVLPGTSGIALAASLRRSRAALRVLFISGHPTHALSGDAIVPGGTAFMAKPFTFPHLAERVRAVLDSSQDSADVAK
jgi:two-component system cell cycle sensor histidine kinase/response regulator CckA